MWVLPLEVTRADTEDVVLEEQKLWAPTSGR